jgi:hypothetical protein
MLVYNMVNEAVMVLKYEDPIDFIVADGTAIIKGAILKNTSPRTASLADGASNVVAGIAARDKVASDGRTRLSVYRKGIFRLLASGAITAGDAVATAGAPSNSVIKILTALSGARRLGFALADISDGSIGEVELDIGCQ